MLLRSGLPRPVVQLCGYWLSNAAAPRDLGQSGDQIAQTRGSVTVLLTNTVTGLFTKLQKAKKAEQF
jgi:hypothetical protein